MAQLTIHKSAEPTTITNSTTGNEQANSATSNTNNNTNKHSTYIKNNKTKIYYCWTHGLSLSHKHTSDKCRFKANGHKEEATATNMMGGCNIIRSGKGPQEPIIHQFEE
eukprot:CAMPEP_0202446870 /NCGR_PEP_ID=MMETSP1360-20130828/5448_1 /ASSEMBLY_ACC=CAM_ASM_000848 /TAXON_ID=515479 /ORGANISM="Licmophora paradoxa, Strain CCMP2313" /LENGTH=108 /DNA_ID=CAMNT_0049063595 /DNA_START=267 /DNA_END=593 /DNA_ORIENTATION=+